MLEVYDLPPQSAGRQASLWRTLTRLKRWQSGLRFYTTAPATTSHGRGLPWESERTHAVAAEGIGVDC